MSSNEYLSDYSSTPSPRPPASDLTNLVAPAPGREDEVRSVEEPLVALLGGNLRATSPYSLIYQSARTHCVSHFGVWKVQAVSQLLNAIELAYPKSIDVANTACILSSIDRMQCEMGFDAATISVLLLEKFSRERSSTLRCRAKEVAQAFVLNHQVPELQEDESLFVYAQGKPTWKSPGYLRLCQDKKEFVKLLKLIVSYVSSEVEMNADDYNKLQSKWRRLTWTDLTEYLYSEEEQYAKLVEVAQAIGVNPPTLTERITNLVSCCRKDVVKRFSEKCRRESINAYRLSITELKKHLAAVVAEIELRLPWETPASAEVVIPERPSCKNCGKRGHVAENCWNGKNQGDEATKIVKTIMAQKEAQVVKKQSDPIQCDHCNGIGHTEPFCWAKNGRPSSRQSGTEARRPEADVRKSEKISPVIATATANVPLGGYMTRSKTRPGFSTKVHATEVVQDAESVEDIRTYMTLDPCSTNTLPTFRTYVNGKAWNVMIDSCSSVSFMNLNDVAELGTTPTPAATTVLQGVHGGTACYNHTVDFPIYVNNKKKCYVKMLVGPAGLDERCVIVGWATMVRMGVNLTPKQISFDVIPGTTFPIVETSAMSKINCVNAVVAKKSAGTTDNAKNVQTLLPDLPIVPQIPVVLTLTTETPRIRTHGYPLSAAESRIMDELIDDLVGQGILKNCDSVREDMHVSPGFLIEKKGSDEVKKYRLLVDLRRLNSRLLTPPYDIHTISDFCRIPRRTRCFAKFDVKNAFFTRSVAVVSHRVLTMKTSSLAPGGFRYTQWCRLPQGLASSPTFWCDRVDGLIIAFREWVNEVSRTVSHVNYRGVSLETAALARVGIKCYIDDGCIFGEDERTVNFVAEIFGRFMTLNGHEVHKVCPACPSIDILGLTLSRKGWQMSEAHSKTFIAALKTTPANVKELQALLGLIQYSRSAFECTSAANCLATLTDPLYAKLKKDEKFVWTSEDQLVLSRIIAAYINLPLSFSSDLDELIAGTDVWVIASDASNIASAGILYRVRLESPRVDFLSNEFSQFVLDQGKIVDNWSHRLSDTERRWLIHEREAWALIKSLQKWQMLIFCSFRTRKVPSQIPSDFPHLVLLTDNTTTLGKFLKAADGAAEDMSLVKIRKWYGWYSEVEGVLKSVPTAVAHVSGSGNVRADLLSRRANTVLVLKTTVVPTSETSPTPTLNDDAMVFSPPMISRTYEEVGELQLEDHESCYQAVPLHQILKFLKNGENVIDSPQLRNKIKSLLHRFELVGGALWFRAPDLTRDHLSGLAICMPRGVGSDVSRVDAETDPPETLREKCLKLVHDASGHPSLDKCLSSLRRMRCWWPSMINDVKTHIFDCPTCLISSRINNHIRLNPICKSFNDRLRYIAVDICGPLTDYNGYANVLTILERYSGFCLFVPIKGEVTAEVIVRNIWVNWIGIFGRIDGIHSDRGSQFTSAVMTGLSKLTNVQLTTSPAYYKQANGQLERCHSTLKRILKIASLHGDADWTAHLPVAQLLLNETPRGSYSYTPAELLFGVKVNQFPTFALLDVADDDDNMRKIRSFAETYEQERLEIKARMIDRESTSSPEEVFEIGDLVMWFNEANPSGKGPYRIIDTTPTRVKATCMGKTDYIHKTQIKRFPRGLAPLSLEVKEGDFVAFPWDQDPTIVVIGKAVKVDENFISCHEYEAGLDGQSPASAATWWPLWKNTTTGAVVRSLTKPRLSEPLLCNCDRSRLLTSGWAMSRNNQVPQPIRRSLGVEF